jgi:effector-binding domain-containing protein
METSTLLECGLVCALLAAASPFALADDPALPRAETILDKLEAKIGDPSARKALKTLRIKGHLAMQGVPDTGRATFEELFLDPDHVKFTLNFGMGGMTMGNAGPVSWTTDPGMGVSVMPAEDAGPVRRMFAIARRADWRSMYEKAETVRKTDVDGRPHWELLMTARGGKQESWFVDCESSVLSRFDLSLPDMMGGVIPAQYIYSDWKPAGGVLFPYKRVQKVMLIEITYNVDSVEPNAPLTAADVAPPADVAAAIADPKKRTPSVPAKGGDVTVDEVKAQPVATIRVTIDAKDVSQTLAKIFPEVGSYCGSIGVAPAGPPFSRYHSITGDKIDLEAGMPVKTPITPKGRVLASELPGGKAAMTWHVGPYTTLPRTYDLLKAWMKEHSVEANGGFWEIYWTDPGLEPDPAKWRTQIYWPLK